MKKRVAPLNDFRAGPKILRHLTVAFVLVLVHCHVAAAPAILTAAGPEEILTKERAKINLNGLWKFQPAAESNSKKVVKSEWGSIWVPGNWYGGGQVGTIQDRGKGEAWKGSERDWNAAWVERTFTVPSSWSGRKILINLHRVSTDAEIWVNDQECGKVSWPYGEVDITKAVRNGAENTLRILVIATPDEGEIINFMGYAQESKSKARLDSAGLIGEVFIESRPMGATVSDVFVQTSTRKGTLTLDVELQGISSSGSVNFTARILDKQGIEVKKFDQAVPVKATDIQVVKMSWPWADAKLWDLDQPNLYTLKLSFSGAGLNDETATRFGFREIWIEGRTIYLNGTPMRLRPILLDSDKAQFSLMDAQLTGLRQQGFNIAQIWPNNFHQRGRIYFPSLWAERADELGMPMIQVAQHANMFVVDSDSKPAWEKNRVRYQKIMEREMRILRNHPSILIWGSSGNLTNHGSDQNPRFLGQRAKLLAVDKPLDGAMEALAMIKAADPTRPAFFHAGNRVGDLFTSNHYLNFIPLQEREEWMSEYVKTGDVPYIGIEFGLPLSNSFMRGRAGYNHPFTSEAWVTEFAAIYGGPETYQKEPDFYRNTLAKKEIPANPRGDKKGEYLMNAPTPFQELQGLFIKNTWRSWRTAGLTGGLVPWNVFNQCWIWKGERVEVEQSPFVPGFRGAWLPKLTTQDLGFLKPNTEWETFSSGEILKEVNNDTLAWITGPADSFTKKDKSFRIGDKIAKQISLINDLRSAANYSVSWKATLEGKEIATGKKDGNLAAGTNLFVPIDFVATSDSKKDKLQGEIILTATIGEKSHTDSFAFRVFQKEGLLKSKVLVVDPLGKTSAMLKAIGVESTPWTGGAAANVLIIGREALSKNTELPGDLEAFTAAGGRVLVMTQNPEWMRSALGFRVSRHVTRYAFPVDQAHPVLSGLDQLDLRDWNSAGTLTEPYPEEPNLKKVPLYGWKWGNQGSVASASIEKPHRSGWRPLIECEFDLAYSPLMELDFGKGRITLCTLDLEDHYQQDPVAARLIRQLLTHVETAPLAPRAEKVVVIGDDAALKKLNQLALIFQPSKMLDPQALNIIGSGSNLDAASVSSFVKAGGRVITLAQVKEGKEFGLKTKSVSDFHGSLSVPTDPLFAGISSSDLRARTISDAVVIESVDDGAILADGLFALFKQGKGFHLAVQLDPTLLDVEKIPALRFTRWRQTRTLSQLLANAGASFYPDRHLFNPRTLTLPLNLPTWKAQMTVTLPAVADDKESARPDPGISAAAKLLVAEQADESKMKTLSLPCNYEGFDNATGEAVFRLTLDLPPEWKNHILSLELGTIADMDTAYFNGVKVGETTDKVVGFNNLERRYRVPANLMKVGKNVVAVRVWDKAFGPGLYGRPNLMKIRVLSTEKAPANFYHSDYVKTFEFGDEPYRYYRW